MLSMPSTIINSSINVCQIVFYFFKFLAVFSLESVSQKSNWDKKTKKMKSRGEKLKRERIKASETNNQTDCCVVVYPISVINTKSRGHQCNHGSYLLSAAPQHLMINRIIVTLFLGNWAEWCCPNIEPASLKLALFTGQMLCSVRVLTLSLTYSLEDLCFYFPENKWWMKDPENDA